MNAAQIEEKLDAKEQEIDAPPESTAPAPKKRGKKKAEVAKEEATVALDTMPDEMIEILAIGPLLLAMAATKVVTERKDGAGNVIVPGIQLHYSNDALKACVPAFKTWLASLDVKMTPGIALLACYSLALASAAPDAMAQFAERGNTKEVPNANPQPAHNVSPGSEQANPPQAIG